MKDPKYSTLSSIKKFMEVSNEGWIEMQPYKEFIFERKLMARFLTNADRIDNICVSTKQSCAFAYTEAKRRFMKSLKEDVNEQIDRRFGRSHKKPFFEKDLKTLDTCLEPNSRSKSRSRSRENFNGSRWEEFEEECPCCVKKMMRQYKHCHCVQMPRCYRGRSGSRSPGFETDFAPMTVEKMRESELNFELYIRQRNQNRDDSSSKRTVIDGINLTSKTMKNKKNEKSASTCIDECEIEIIGGKGSSRKEDFLNETEIDFEQFLEKLKIEDSKHDYSAFDLEENENHQLEL